MKNDEFAKVLSVRPKHVIYWARRDVISHWLGRTVSVKMSYERYQSPHLLGTIVEVGPSGWVTVQWEDGSINANFNRKELDTYQGPLNWTHRELLIDEPTAYCKILKNLQEFDRSVLRRNGFPIDYVPKKP